MGEISKRDAGARAEQLALDYLLAQGLIFIEKNYRAKCGEIDLIMRDNQYIIFIEVRYRKSNLFGGALESIDWRKQQKLMNAAKSYFWKGKWARQLPSRFDVVALSGSLDNVQLEWIKNAFWG